MDNDVNLLYWSKCMRILLSKRPLFIYPLDLNKSNSVEFSCYPATVIDVSIHNWARPIPVTIQCNIKPKTFKCAIHSDTNTFDLIVLNPYSSHISPCLQ